MLLLTERVDSSLCKTYNSNLHIKAEGHAGRSSCFFAKPNTHVYNAHQIEAVWYVKWNVLHIAITPLLSITVGRMIFFGKSFGTPNYYATISNMSDEPETCPEQQNLPTPPSI